MLSFNIGSYLTQLMRFYPITLITQDYVRGVIERTVLPPEMILAHVQPRKKSTEQVMQHNSDRVVGHITIFTLDPLNLTRQSNQSRQITYKDNEYFITGTRNWSEYGYFQHFGELIIPESTG